MSELKRLPVKYIRDLMKADYKAKDHCYICGTKEKLELHHVYSVSDLFDTWRTKNRVLSIDTVEEMNIHRAEFYKDCAEEMAPHNTYTLCKKHHELLHSIYGLRYSNNVVNKVKNWLEIQRGKWHKVDGESGLAKS